MDRGIRGTWAVANAGCVAAFFGNFVLFWGFGWRHNFSATARSIVLFQLTFYFCFLFVFPPAWEWDGVGVGVGWDGMMRLATLGIWLEWHII